MFDTMTITKAFASVCGALLVLLLGGWAAESLYNIEKHGDDHVPGYAILVHDDSAEEAPAEEVVEVALPMSMPPPMRPPVSGCGASVVPAISSTPVPMASAPIFMGS